MSRARRLVALVVVIVAGAVLAVVAPACQGQTAEERAIDLVREGTLPEAARAVAKLKPEAAARALDAAPARGARVVAMLPLTVTPEILSELGVGKGLQALQRTRLARYACLIRNYAPRGDLATVSGTANSQGIDGPTARELVRMRPAQAAAELAKLRPEDAAGLLSQMAPRAAGRILAAKPGTGAKALALIGLARADRVLRTIVPAQRLRLLRPLKLARYTCLTGLPAPEPSQALNPLGIAHNVQLVAPEDREALLDGIKAAGAGWVRFDFAWSAVQPNGPNQWSWKQLDDAVTSANARGLRVLGMLGYAPDWAGGFGVAPTDNAAFARFAEMTVRRYAPRGVKHWEIWNEPNYKTFWNPPDPAAYTRLIQVAYPAIKRADPKAYVLAGATAPGDVGLADDIAAPEFVSAMYANGAHGFFDGLSHHPYTAPASPVDSVPDARGWQWLYTSCCNATANLRDLMVSNGDADKQIWVTEFGAETDPGFSRSVNEEQQAAIARDALQLWANYPWAGPFFWFSLRDAGGAESYGLLRQDGSRKPSWHVFRAEAAKR
jgi:hypothetical protein